MRHVGAVNPGVMLMLHSEALRVPVQKIRVIFWLNALRLADFEWLRLAG